MVSLEQVKLLESKVIGAIDYVKKVTEENTRLKGKLDSNQKRIEELEVLIRQFKEEQSRIEDGILSALDRLNQFEDALESKLSTESKLSAEDSSNSKGSVKDKPIPAAKAVPKKDGPKEKSASGSIKEPEASIKEDDSKSGEELDIF